MGNLRESYSWIEEKILVIVQTRIWTSTKACFLFLSLCLLLATYSAAVDETVIHSFAGAGTGTYPLASPVSDSAGNLYGSTQAGGEFGGDYGYGTIFELVKGRKSWTYKVLYSFTGNTDGGSVTGSLVLDSQGNLYGVASTGGDDYKGNVFELSPSQGGGWALTVLYSFTAGSDGGYPQGGVILDKAGNLYGTTYYGGLLSDCSGAGCGVVFELSPGLDGSWTESVLHSFTETEGALPNSEMVFGAKGILYGTTSAGGTSTNCEGSPANGCGTVFRLAPSEGGWTETTLLSFDVANGDFPESVIFHDGKVYGTTFGGGSQSEGTVFELTLTKSGATEEVIHSFGSGTDATQPTGSVFFGNKGNLYGSASRGGNSGCGGQGCGAIFELTPSGGSWTESILYQFTGSNDGGEPYGTPILSKGELVGTASSGGASGYGTVFGLPQGD
jgi:uncharacterized repeat protein (TIGR03803 family)